MEQRVEAARRRVQKATARVRERLAKAEFHTTFQGLPVHIEHDRGDTRNGVAPDGTKWATTMTHPYGEITGTRAVDGDPLDVFIGPNPHATHCYAIESKLPGSQRYDEMKLMLGFDTQEQAVAAFRQNYDRSGFFLDVTKWPMAALVELVQKHPGLQGGKLDAAKLAKVQQLAKAFWHRWNACGLSRDFLVRSGFTLDDLLRLEKGRKLPPGKRVTHADGSVWEGQVVGPEKRVPAEHHPAPLDLSGVDLHLEGVNIHSAAALVHLIGIEPHDLAPTPMDRADVAVERSFDGDVIVTVAAARTDEDFKKPRPMRLMVTLRSDRTACIETMRVHPPGGGRGLHVVSRMISRLQAAGYTEIDLVAARSEPDEFGEGMNGYYTWPRYGWDATYSVRAMSTVPPALPPALRHVRRISDLMQTKEGRDWWSQHGSSMPMTFSLAPDSLNQRVHRAYLEEKRLQPARKAVGPELDPSAEDEAALDRAWERIRKELEERPDLREDDDAFDASYEAMLERRRRHEERKRQREALRKAAAAGLADQAEAMLARAQRRIQRRMAELQRALLKGGRRHGPGLVEGRDKANRRAWLKPKGIPAALEHLSRHDGPRKLGTKHGLTPDDHEAMAAFVDHHGTRVALNAKGAAFLIKHATPAERERIVRAAAPRHRDALIAAWRKVASPAERARADGVAHELYGHLVQPPDGGAHAHRLTLAKELAHHWSQLASPEAKAQFGRAMVAVGIQPIGTAGHRVVFSGREHVSTDAVFPGDPVEVVEPGWALPSPDGPVLVAKAKVRASGR